jgi:hypothetical protein
MWCPKTVGLTLLAVVNQTSICGAEARKEKNPQDKTKVLE